MLIDPRELVGLREAARMSGLSLSGFKLARSAGRTPEPVVTLVYGPLWTRSQIEDWTAERAASRP